MSKYSHPAHEGKNNLKPSANWSQLLIEAVTKPGLLSSAYAAFHNYSIGNQLLALVQCEQRNLPPGPICTFQGWQGKGRRVKKGERALWLCIPIKLRRRDEAEQREERGTFTTFVFKPRWFVLSQTEGDPVEPPPIPAWDRARALAALGITEIPFEELNGNVQGYARKRSIAISPLAVMPHKTTFHELAHVVLGHTEEMDFADTELTPKNLREAEAECVALILCESLSLPGAEFSRGYVQNWLAGDIIPEKSAQKIFSAADKILKAGAPVAASAEVES